MSGVKGTAMGLWPAEAGPLLWSRALVMAKHKIMSRKSSFGQIIKILKKALTLFLLKHLQFSHLPVLHPRERRGVIQTALKVLEAAPAAAEPKHWWPNGNNGLSVSSPTHPCPPGFPLFPCSTPALILVGQTKGRSGICGSILLPLNCWN